MAAVLTCNYCGWQLDLGTLETTDNFIQTCTRCGQDFCPRCVGRDHQQACQLLEACS